MTNPTRSLVKRPVRAAIMMLLSTIAWGASFPLQKAAILAELAVTPGMATWVQSALLLGVRFAICAVIMVLWLLARRERMTPREWSQGLMLGVFSSCGLLLQVDGLNYTEASTSAFITQCYCVIIPIWVALRHQRMPSVLLATCCVSVIVGVAILSGIDPRNMKLGRGEWETVISSLFFTAQILWLERGEYAGNNSGHVSLAMYLMIALIQLPIAIMGAGHVGVLVAPLASHAVLGLLVALVLFCTLLAFGIMNHWQPHLEATQAGLICRGEPLFASIFALFAPALISQWCHVSYANEPLTWRLMLGGGLILGANLVVLLRQTGSTEAARRNRPD
ncbi:MAG: DMT family transporter [Chthoniobacteraceae bacterium]